MAWHDTFVISIFNPDPPVSIAETKAVKREPNELLQKYNKVLAQQFG